MPEATPSERLILVALELFGARGFEGTSTREIAAAAGRPMSAITYHFGSKAALYRAVAEYIAARMSEQIAPVLDALGPPEAARAPEEAARQVRTLIAALLAKMMRPETASWAGFIVREQMDPTAAFDALYGGPMAPLLGRLTALVLHIAGQRLTQDQARLHAITMVGQVLVFRLARAAVLRATGWSDIGAAETAAIETVVLAQIDAILASLVTTKIG
jgi:AcrR family transcriptional regulator